MAFSDYEQERLEKKVDTILDMLRDSPSDDPVIDILLEAELEVVRSDEMTQEEKDKAIKAIEEVRRKRDDDPYKSHDTVDRRDPNDPLLKHYRLLVKENAELNKERDKVLNVVLQQFHKEHPTTKDGECMPRRCKDIVQQEMGSSSEEATFPPPEEGAQPGSIMDTMYNLKRILKKDPGYRKSWRDNIAMAFKDEMDREVEKMPINDNSIHEAANNAAEQFLQQLEG